MDFATRTHASSPGVALSEAEVAVVRTELEHIVRHPLFGHSKRYPALLAYVVTRALEGRSEELKERTVGIDALGRPASYDTNQDPVVRTTAAEVRKRLAQYYQQANGSAQVRIDLPVGSYVPHFAFPGTAPVAGSATTTTTVGPSSAVTTRLRRWILHPLPLALVAVAGVAVTGLLAFWRPAPPAMEKFWSPVLAAPGTVLVGVGKAAAVSSETDVVTLNAATAASRIVGVLQTRAKGFEVKAVDTIDFADVRSQPVIAIGGFNNKWTMTVTSALRFGFGRDPVSQELEIVDRFNTQATGWSRVFDRSGPTPRVVEDFALVVRVRDAQSGQQVLTVGGIGIHGTAAAGEFLTSAEHLERFAATAPIRWERGNVELVIATTVVDGVAGPPRVVATHVWH